MILTPIFSTISSIFRTGYVFGDSTSSPYDDNDTNDAVEKENAISKNENFNYGNRVHNDFDLVPYHCRCGLSMWSTRDISDYDSCERILNHMKTATEVRAYVSNYHGQVICSFYTKKFGWVRCNMSNRLEFGVYKTGIRYDVEYTKRLGEIHPELAKFVCKMYDRWHNEWKNDVNL